MPKKKHRTPQACIHLYNPPGSTGGVPQPAQTNPHTQKCKTNPISPQRHPNYAKRTQFIHPADPSTHTFCETNPIYTYARGMPCPIYAKRTQFPHTKHPTTPDFSETNPILSLLLPCAYCLFLRNEANLPKELEKKPEFAYDKDNRKPNLGSIRLSKRNKTVNSNMLSERKRLS